MDPVYLQAIKEIEQEEKVLYPRKVVEEMARKRWGFDTVDFGRPDEFFCAIPVDCIPLNKENLIVDNKIIVNFYWISNPIPVEQFEKITQLLNESKYVRSDNNKHIYTHHELNYSRITFPQLSFSTPLQTMTNEEICRYREDYRKKGKLQLYKEWLTRPIRYRRKENKLIKDPEGDLWLWCFGIENQGSICYTVLYSSVDEDPPVLWVDDYDEEIIDDIELWETFSQYTKKIHTKNSLNPRRTSFWNGHKPIEYEEWEN